MFRIATDVPEEIVEEVDRLRYTLGMVEAKTSFESPHLEFLKEKSLEIIDHFSYGASLRWFNRSIPRSIELDSKPSVVWDDPPYMIFSFSSKEEATTAFMFMPPEINARVL
jgi:hypothetical protein